VRVTFYLFLGLMHVKQIGEKRQSEAIKAIVAKEEKN